MAQDYCYAVTSDPTYIYAGLYTTPAQVIKIDPQDMATLATWQGDEGQDLCCALTFDGQYIYAGLRTIPGQVVQIDPATMTTVDTWTAIL